MLHSNVGEETDTFKRIFGKPDDLLNLNFGNVNAFKLNTRYENEQDQAFLIATKLDLHDRGYFASVKKYINLFAKAKLLKTYQNYYFKTFGTPFNDEFFGNYRYAKFNRDIHDQYFNQIFGNKKSIKEKLEYIFFKKS